MEKKVSSKPYHDIQKYDEERMRKKAEKELSSGCWTSSSRVVINEDEEKKRKKRSEEFRILGNESFRNNDFSTAKEYYSSAIAQHDQNPILFNNRAQTSLRLKNYEDAIKDTLHSVQLSPNIVKTYVILARGFKGQKEYNKALEVLFTLQNSQNVLTDLELKVIHNLVKEINEAM